MMIDGSVGDENGCGRNCIIFWPYAFVFFGRGPRSRVQISSMLWFFFISFLLIF